MGRASLEAIDESLQNHLWIYDDPGLSELDCRNHLMLEALFHLDPTLSVSEQGFDRSDATLLGTPEVIDRWHRLMTGMNRLFVAVGLSPRTMNTVAGSDAVTSDLVLRSPR
jgi:Holliday junction resolvasome RuvABC ATP-dependent DNA helicase subunit